MKRIKFSEVQPGDRLQISSYNHKYIIDVDVVRPVYVNADRKKVKAISASRFRSTYPDSTWIEARGLFESPHNLYLISRP